MDISNINRHIQWEYYKDIFSGHYKKKIGENQLTGMLQSRGGDCNILAYAELVKIKMFMFLSHNDIRWCRW